MTEKELLQLLKGQQLSEKALTQKTESFTAQEKGELMEMLGHLMKQGIVGKHDDIYYLLKDMNVFLAKVIVKTHNFVILQSIPEGFEARISGVEADGLLLGDLVYAKQFQQGVYHCLDYYKAVSSLTGRYSLTQNGKPQIVIEYLNKAGKTVLVNKVNDDIASEINQGDLVTGDIVSFKGNTIKVNVRKILVKSDDVGSDISMIIAENDAPLSFPEEVIEEAKSISQEVPEDALKDRTDFRGHCVVTIDGDDAHDFDDAVEAKVFGNGYEITVHIADVTEYVRPNHPLDDEAKVRGTSIYVADRVVPMLPFELSNGICSLNPDVDRLVLSVTMCVDAQGYVYKSKIERGVIRSHGRLTYNKVNAFFNGEECDYSDEIKETLTILHNAAKAIRKRRNFQGAMRLDSTEIKFRLDETGMPTDVVKETQGESEMMIEDMMIIANVAVAKALKEAHIPVLYRVHEFPPKDRLSSFREFLKKVDLARVFPKNENISGARLNDFLSSIKDDAVRSTVSYMMLRAMAKARYSPEELGHFGLAELEYCHFTSPIRRYPDDLIHRLVKDYLIDQKTFDYEDVYARLAVFGDELTDDEIRATSIEREVNDLESSKYMTQHIGELYHGKVVGMVSRGMFIELENGIEGFLAYHCMHGDYFTFNERYFEVVGKETDVSFTIGTPVDVKVLAADPVKEEIDLATPEFYDRNAVGLSNEERMDLSLNGIHIFAGEDEEEFEDDDKENNEMNNEEKDYENLTDAMDSFEEKEAELEDMEEEEEDRDFRPSPEQWKEVDVIRAVVAKYPDDEEKVIQVLSVMDIDEAEYRKLLRFTKPREDRGGRSGRGGRGGFGGGRGGDRRGGGRSFGGRGGDRRGHGDRGGDRGERRGGSRSGFGGGRGGDRRDSGAKRSFPDHKGYASYHKDGDERRSSFGDRDSRPSRGGDRGGRSFSRDGGRSSYRDSDRRSAPRSSSRGGSSRGGYGRKRRGE